MCKILRAIVALGVVCGSSVLQAKEVRVSELIEVGDKGSQSLGTIHFSKNTYRIDREWRGANITLIVNTEKEETIFIVPERKVFFIASSENPERTALDPFLTLFLVLKRYESKPLGEQKVAGMNCDAREVYSGQRLVFSACVSKEFGIPLSITEHVPTPHTYSISEPTKLKVADTFFDAPSEYRQLRHFPFNIPKWAMAVGVSPVMKAPGQTTLKPGQVVRVPIVKGKSIRISGSRVGKGNASYLAVPFHNGEPTYDPERNIYAQGTRKIFSDPPKIADEIVIRAVEGTLTIRAELVDKK